MEFKKAYEMLKQGYKIKRAPWTGYWAKEDGTIMMHCKDGSVIGFMETDDVFRDIDEILCNDWIVLDINEDDFDPTPTKSFGSILYDLKAGRFCARKGWNGKGIFIALQTPDEHSKMTHPYIYIDTTGLQTTNPNAPKNRVPWLASQTDMLATDWYVID